MGAERVALTDVRNYGVPVETNGIDAHCESRAGMKIMRKTYELQIRPVESGSVGGCGPQVSAAHGQPRPDASGKDIRYVNDFPLWSLDIMAPYIGIDEPTFSLLLLDLRSHNLIYAICWGHYKIVKNLTAACCRLKPLHSEQEDPYFSGFQPP